MQKHLNILMASCLALGLSACGGGGGSTETASSSILPTTSDSQMQIQNMLLSGSVGDGPIVGASVSVFDANGDLISVFNSDSQANYQAEINTANATFPLTLVATGGTDLVTGMAPDFALLSIAESNADTQVNLNPFSTLIVETASKMPGGLSVSSNVANATQVVMEIMNFGLDTAIVPNPTTAPITTANISHIVKSSETFGEMIRRTRDNLITSGATVAGDDVIQALAADLADGQLDGQGAPGTDPHITALAKLTTGQVAIEAMSNQLYVNGVLATPALDSSIQITLPGTPNSALTSSVGVNSTIIDQAKIAMAAANAIAPSSSLNSLADTLNQVVPGSHPSVVSAILNAADSAVLSQSITSTVLANSQEIELVNSATMASYPDGEENTPNSVPVAVNDSASSTGSTVTISPLTNDSGLADTPVSLSIIAGPTSGTISLNGNNTVAYTPVNEFEGTDSFTYAITDNNGDMATATVSISVTCASCNVEVNKNVTLSWDASAGSDVLGYYVYYGDTANTATTFASQESNTSVTYQSIDDLQLQSGDSVCFRVKAYNSIGESSFTSAICGTI